MADSGDSTDTADNDSWGRMGTGEPPAQPVHPPLPIEDQAYQLHVRGFSYREIGRRLGLDKDTVNRYVKAIEREVAPKRKADRERWTREAVQKLTNVQAHAYDRFDETGEAQLLNTVVSCEREIAKLRGLYDTLVDEDGGGITIRITRHGDGSDSGDSGDSSETGA